MNNTELKTLRQSLFLSVAEAAALHHVRERVYRYWESGDWAVPDDVEALMRRLDDDANAVVSNAVAACETAATQGRPAVLIRFASDEDLQAMTARTIWTENLLEMPASAYAAGIDRARQDLKYTAAAPRLVTMDRAAYQAWLDQHGDVDSGKNRQDWARTVTDPPTRAQKATQASGEEKSS